MQVQFSIEHSIQRLVTEIGDYDPNVHFLMLSTGYVDRMDRVNPRQYRCNQMRIDIRGLGQLHLSYRHPGNRIILRCVTRFHCPMLYN